MKQKSLPLLRIQNHGDNTSRQFTSTFNAGTSIQSIIDNMLTNTSWAEEQYVKINDKTKNDKTKKVDFIPKSYFIETVVNFTSYDLLTNEYNKEIIYYVHPYTAIFPEIESFGMNSEETKDVKKDTAETKIAEIERNKVLRKKYSYVFTGENTEVLEFDLSYNLTWQALLPSYSGATGDSSKTPTKLYDDRQEKLKKTAEEIAGDKTLSRAEKVALLANKRREQLSIVKQYDATNNADEFTSAYAGLRASQIQKLINENRTLDYDDFSKSNRLTGKEFAEDLPTNIDSLSKRNNNVVSRLPVTTGDSRLTTNQGNQARSTEVVFQGGKNYMAAIFNQVYSTSNPGFMQMDMKVRGDPYWLGRSEYYRYTQLNVLAEETNGDLIISDIPTEKPNTNGFVLNSEQAAQYLLFTMKTPSVYRDTDENLSLSATLAGLYYVTIVNNTFSGGQFTQQLHIVRDTSTSPYAINAKKYSAANKKEEEKANEAKTSTVPVAATGDLETSVASRITYDDEGAAPVPNGTFGQTVIGGEVTPLRTTPVQKLKPNGSFDQTVVDGEVTQIRTKRINFNASGEVGDEFTPRPSQFSQGIGDE